MRTFKYDIAIVFRDLNRSYRRMFTSRKSIELYTHNSAALRLLQFIKKFICKNKLLDSTKETIKECFSRWLPQLCCTKKVQTNKMGKTFSLNLLFKPVFHTHLIADTYCQLLTLLRVAILWTPQKNMTINTPEYARLQKNSQARSWHQRLSYKCAAIGEQSEEQVQTPKFKLWWGQYSSLGMSASSWLAENYENELKTSGESSLGLQTGQRLWPVDERAGTSWSREFPPT